MSKKMIIKGVGTFMAKRLPKDPNGQIEVITLGTLQDLKIDMNVEIEDIFGGDGLFAIDTLVKSKSIEISATDARFDLDQLQLMMGSRVDEQVASYIWVLNEQNLGETGELDASNPGTSVAQTELEYGASIYSFPEVSVRLKDTSKLLKEVPISTTVAPLPSEFMIEKTGTGVSQKVRIILNPVHVNKDVVVNYKRTETVDLVDILVDEVPFPVSVVHHGSFLQKDGSFQGIETELYSCIAKGNFSINAQRASASTSQVALQIIDPERADGKIGSIKRYSSTTKS